MSSTSNQRVRAIAVELQSLGVRLWLDESGAHLEPKEKVTADMRAELRNLKAEVIEYLVEQGETLVDDPEERAHSDMRTPPRTPEEVDKQRTDADRAREKARRKYQGGVLLVNDPNAMRYSAYMSQLVKERERREAVASGALPPEGRYQTRWDLFNRREYE
jgi:hypothetical protein